jgi:hypothetical protein
LKLLALGGDHMTTKLGFWRLVYISSPFADFNIFEAE